MEARLRVAVRHHAVPSYRGSIALSSPSIVQNFGKNESNGAASPRGRRRFTEHIPVTILM
jgi:hypothetical protein